MRCEGDGIAGVRDRGGVVGVSSWHEYVGGTRGLDIVSNVADVLGMSVVRGINGVGGTCEICMYLAGGSV